MPREEFFVLTDPHAPPVSLPPSALPVHPVFRLGPRMELLLLRGSERLRGGILMVSAPSTVSAGNVEHVCRQLLFACAARGCRGVFLNFDGCAPLLSAAAVCLGRELARRNMPLLLPEGYAALVPSARVLISSALSGGSLEQRLKQASNRFGRQRVILALEPAAEDFPLPAPEGRGAPLSQSELDALRREQCARDFFSPALCCRYFLYRNRNSAARLVLFDDPDSLNAKLNCARAAGFHAFLIPARAATQTLLFS